MHFYPPITERNIRLALVDCGRVSDNYFSAIQKHKGRLELVDVCDENATELEQAVARTKASGHCSLTEMLKTTTVMTQ